MFLTVSMLVFAQAAVDREPQTIHVCSQAGDDAATGEDRDNPLGTIEAALQRAHGGDTNILLPRTFYIDRLAAREPIESSQTVK
jgi:hypothetical protein